MMINSWQLHDAFTCQVTSSPTLAPIMKTVTIELNCKIYKPHRYLLLAAFISNAYEY